MKKNILIGVSFLTLCISLVQAQQKSLQPVKVESSTSKEDTILITASGVEHDPVPVQGHWNSDDSCLTDIQCFVSSWIDANSNGNIEHLVALRAPSERSDFEQMLARKPNMVALNKDRFKTIKRWSIVGWVQYGTFRIVILVREEEQSSTLTYTLPLMQTSGRWGQTDALTNDKGVYAIIDRIANAVMERHRPKTAQSR